MDWWFVRRQVSCLDVGWDRNFLAALRWIVLYFYLYYTHALTALLDRHNYSLHTLGKQLVYYYIGLILIL